MAQQRAARAEARAWQRLGSAEERNSDLAAALAASEKAAAGMAARLERRDCDARAAQARLDAARAALLT